jgi:hypothetical protein
MFLRSTSCILLLLAAAATLSAQDYLWDRTYGDSGKPDYANAVIHTSDGGFLLMGSTESISGGPRAIESGYVVKTDSLGAKQWARAVGTAEHTRLLAGHEMPDGGFLVVGNHADRNTNPVQIARLDPNGIIIWQRSFGTDSVIEPDDLWELSAAAPTSDYGFLVAGRGYSSKVAYWHVDSLGDPVWRRSYEGASPDAEFPQVSEYPMGISESPDGDAIVTGYTNATTDGGYHTFALRLGPNGDSLWWHTYEFILGLEQSNTYGTGVTAAASGFLVAGYVMGDNIPGSKAFAMRLSANGDLLHDQMIEHLEWGLDGEYQSFSMITPIDDNRYVAVGAITTQRARQAQALVAIIDSNGNVLRAVGAGKTGEYPVGRAIVPISGSRYAIAGSVGYLGTDSDALLMLTGPPPPSSVQPGDDTLEKMWLSDLPDAMRP